MIIRLSILERWHGSKRSLKFTCRLLLFAWLFAVGLGALQEFEPSPIWNARAEDASKPTNSAQYHFERALELDRSGQFDEATKEYEDCLAAPEFPHASMQYQTQVRYCVECRKRAREKDYFADLLFSNAGGALREQLGCWSRQDMPLKVYLPPLPAADGFSADERKTVQECLDEWVKALGGRLSYVFSEQEDESQIRLHRVTDECMLAPVELGKTVSNYYQDDHLLRRLKLSTIRLGKSERIGTGRNVFKHVCCHELGHALGFYGHSCNARDLMFFYTSGNTGLTPRDVETARIIYSDNAEERARTLLLEGAKSGNRRAQFALGSNYENGRGFPKSEKDAIDWYIKAANQKLPEAQFQLGSIFSFKRKDFAAGFSWFQAAAQQAFPPAVLQMGRAYEYGLGCKQDFVKAQDYFRKAAETLPDAMRCLAYMYVNGRGVERDTSKAITLYHKAAKLGDPGAEYDLACLYEMGTGVPQDYKQALQHFKLAAQGGDPDSEKALAIYYSTGLCVPTDWPEAIRWYQRAADDRQMQACVALAELYETGSHVPLDRARARDLLERAAEQDNIYASYLLARLYQQGINGKPNLEEAKKWDDKAHSIIELMRVFDASSYVDRGIQWQTVGHYDAAIKDLQEALKMRPINEWNVRLHLAGCLTQAGRESDAEKELSDLVKTDEQTWRAMALHDAAFNHLCMQKYSEAEDEFNKSIALEHNENSLAYSYIQLCLLYEAQHKNTQSVSLLEKARDRFQNNKAWPFPVLEYLRGALSLEKLFAIAGSDPGELTEAKAYTGLHILFRGNSNSAKKNLDWVCTHGRPDYYEIELCKVFDK